MVYAQAVHGARRATDKNHNRKVLLETFGKSIAALENIWATPTYLQISELDLGSQFPEIKSLEVSNVELHPHEGHIENLDILMNLTYKGDFLLKIDADMVLGKKGSLSLRGNSNT